MVIICASSCQKLTKSEIGQVEVGSNIAQNHFFSPRKSYVVLYVTIHVKS